MIDADPLPDRPGASVDAEEWSFHHRLLYRLVLGSAGATTSDLQLLYDAVASVAYRGTTASPSSSRRWRRKILNDLRDAGVIDAHRTSRGWVWTPTESVLQEEAGARGAPDAEVSPTDA